VEATDVTDPRFGPPGPPVTGYGSPVPVPMRGVRVDPIPGTSFGLAYVTVNPTVSGLAVGSMVAGIGSVAVSALVYCFGLAGAADDWGVLVSGAFVILAVVVGSAAIATGLVSLRQIRRAPNEQRGRGLAVTGLACGGSGVGLALLGLLVAILAAASGTG
jgi:Domain of unknown function (DUF4190)